MSDHLKLPNGENSADMLILGAGLSGLLLAWRCLYQYSDFVVVIVEQNDQIAGDHTWSFNRSDIPDHLHEWLAPMIVHEWPQYDVRFPKYQRTLNIPYCSSNSDSLRAAVQPYIDEGRLIIQTGMRLDDDDMVTGLYGPETKIIDARGFVPRDDVHLGYQKFVGQVIETPIAHGINNPIIMDATVDQLEGYRFVYCLPYSDTQMLVEDTYYTDGDELSEDSVKSRLSDYITQNLGLADYRVIAEEKGVLPITLARASAGSGEAIGIRGGFYHAVTGYSLPQAVRVADAFARSRSAQVSQVINAQAQAHYKSEGFFRLLNRMLFRAAEPEQRYKVLQRFYRLSEPLIKRFYAGEITLFDKIRILTGKPPVPINKALSLLSERGFIKREKSKRN